MWLKYLVPRRLREYAARCTQSGFIPRVSPTFQWFIWFIARFWVFVQVGRMRVFGRENLNYPGARLIFCANHSCMLDGPVQFALHKKQPRYMTAFEEMQGLGGAQAVLMGAAGCFPVDRRRGHTVVEPAVGILVAGYNLNIMPEGRISPNGEYLPFKSGSARIAMRAYERMGRQTPVGIVPIHICYGRRDEATAATTFGQIGFNWRGGVTVNIGEPIWLHDIQPYEPRNLMRTVRAAIAQHFCTTSFDGPVERQ
jgi:1-acyl-sn-glycerol-3-phosphate acyltransferase